MNKEYHVRVKARSRSSAQQKHAENIEKVLNYMINNDPAFALEVQRAITNIALKCYMRYLDVDEKAIQQATPLVHPSPPAS